ncbi:type II secretion system inner membrane protein GspF [Reinekea marina]|uniref:Type II secretion system inner membrane protein GspF n=1 Tax=Reinekea marina TaxID=1310421 RepID=A0ABV7WNL0_9GAMM|nr:type II secretion system inner membrane protein GspF [Reinekea marina]MBU2863291.1 type II secretion system inner membrane protein GspF [Reinekea forsetii]MDN3649506.1 type II secretion system inner membrane protein GspF [Reinekea marina]
MAAYEYLALDAQGKKKKGALEADSARQVRQQLRDKGWYPESVELSTKSRKQGGGFSTLIGPKLSVSDLSLVTRQLSTLVGSGMPLEECLRAAAEQSEKIKVRNIMLSVRSKVLEGYSLAKALEEYPRAFPVLYRATVQAGEHSGHLDEVMDRLADYMEEQRAINAQVLNASIYPGILSCIAIGIVILLLNTVVPEIVGVFVNSGAELPKPTQVLLQVSEAIQNHWGKGLIGIALFIIAIVMFNKKPQRRIRTHRLYLKLPLIARISKGFNTSRFIGTIAMLSSSGVPLVEAMKIATQVVTNLEIQQRVSRAAVKVSEGGSLYQALKEAGYFRPMMLHMIGSGETSGELDIMLQKTADAETKSIQILISSILSLFEPLMILVMGVIVLIIVLAIVLPMLTMNTLAG